MATRCTDDEFIEDFMANAPLHERLVIAVLEEIYPNALDRARLHERLDAVVRDAKASLDQFIERCSAREH
jgi:hypothetical protein